MNDVGLDATPIQHVESAPGLVGSVSISFGSLDFGFARIERGGKGIADNCEGHGEEGDAAEHRKAHDREERRDR